MNNPNEYDEQAYQRATTQLADVVYDAWNAGAEEGDILYIVESALKDCEE